MPHAVSVPDAQEQADNSLISNLLSGGNDGQDNFDFLNRDLVPGEKAQDAVDFEDISDDDLAEEEDAPDTTARANGDVAGDTEDDLLGESFTELNGDGGDDDPFADLFGDEPSSPTTELDGVNGGPQADSGSLWLPPTGRLSLPGSFAKPQVDRPAPRQPSPESASPQNQPSDIEDESDEDPELREQRQLFAQARRDREDRSRRGGASTDLPPHPQTNAEIFEAIWPDFEQDKPPRFGVLLPGKRAFYLAKTPSKAPKPIQPTKVSLELGQDQERGFRLAGATTAKAARQAEVEQKGLVPVIEAESGEPDSDDDMELDIHDERENIGGVTWQDFNVLCEDWDIRSEASSGAAEIRFNGEEDVFDFDDNYDAPPPKKRKVAEREMIPIYQDTIPPLDDPEAVTAKISRRITLDLNDPQMLIDIQPPDVAQKRARAAGSSFRKDVQGSLTKTLFRRYNISNDEAYDALKENHSHKVRSTLGNLTVEHSLPALKLQYPFYKVKLSAREARSFHRPSIHFHPNQLVTFSKLKSTKRKHLKGKETQEIFKESADLTLGDNSNMVLMEYSEEYPIMMSNFGMGSRLINYYRRKDAEDNTRPKLDIGETTVLLPQDKSPFSLFGNIEPGQTMPTLHNAMFRAPVFKQEAKPTDFLVGRSTTGVHGSNWYMRNIENVYVVGQEFPSVEVPGTHSRKVTEAAKRRLRMISYRVFSKNQRPGYRGPPLSNDVIRQHLPGTDIAQNRGKMREFMQYDKDSGTWVPKKGDVIPDDSTMRSWIKPEDICLLDSMQVGHRHLQDAGYSKEEDVAGDDDEEKDGQSLEQQLAPWQTTKNFLNACQGKAMLQLHGEGDPSGRGEAFSFVKTSMKGGFKAVGESIEDKLDAKRIKELGGHSYNVARQQRAYEDSIKRIWEAQQRSLSSTIEHSDVEMSVDEEPEHPHRDHRSRSEVGTPAGLRRDDETTSQFSRFSTSSQKGKVLRITRMTVDRFSGKLEPVEEIIKDPKVIRAYLKRKREQELNNVDLSQLKSTGDKEQDELRKKLLLDELARLERNKERRHVREKAKGLHNGSSSQPATPGSPSAGPSKAAGTQRRCANCGQVGHIKTNKKYYECNICLSYYSVSP
ncbi:hypothetical protein W97_06163 [Coniosporium apollinis CBS 100218]|uniref:Transcription initiation factor TFIID subunit 1 histone acetyltransferase domain-containing protein n=1 Tax=Coniosporium apollinis (strain CBS 100218) TaxID=1168221 RepID=R7YZG5_CONA1|nr:uncharacterized protein W97_06163 [Coniosporium apollinis CBS 100218]EON67046.1 hypothetical protein W97_06163 [Coniosporium apollinis CBS 100218]